MGCVRCPLSTPSPRDPRKGDRRENRCRLYVRSHWNNPVIDGGSYLRRTCRTRHFPRPFLSGVVRTSNVDRTSKSVTPEVAAYLAGLVDGDGYVGILRRRTGRTRSGFSYYCDMEVASVFPGFLEKVHQLIGEGCWRQSNPGFKSRRPLYHLKVWPNTLRWLLPLMTPHVRLKKVRAVIVLDHLPSQLKGRHGQSPESERRYWALRRMSHRGRT